MTTHAIHHFRIRGSLLIPLFFCAGALIFNQQANAQCAGMLKDGSFEQVREGRPVSGWHSEGVAGFEINKGKAYDGNNNCWAKSDKGWSGFRMTMDLSSEYTYTLRAFIMTSDNFGDGYFGFRDATQRPVKEIKFSKSKIYHELTVRYKPSVSGRYYIFGGLWAPGEMAWMRIDKIDVYGPCGDVQLNPAEN